MPIKVKGDWEGIPGFWLDDPHSPDGKRFIATHHGWDLIQVRLRQEVNYRCELNLSPNCVRSMHWLDIHHRRGRGGGKRDDRIVVASKRNLLACCRPCHDVAKIERKMDIYDAPADDAQQSDRPRLPSR